MLAEVADGVFVRQSRFCQTNAVVVGVDRGLILIDPGVTGDELSELADDLEALGGNVVAGFSTHPHWDHVLWHGRFGLDVPRYATRAGAATCRSRLDSLREMTARCATGASLDLVGAVSPVPEPTLWADWGLRLVEHEAHSPGHAAVVVLAAGALIAGDMLSDVEIPLLDPEADDPWGGYLIGLNRIDAVVTRDLVALIPGHGQVAHGADILSRVDADRAYLDALRRSGDPTDLRVRAGATYGQDWLPEAHQRNIRLARS